MTSNSFEKEIKPLELKKDYPLAKHTTWKVGGPAEYFVEVKTKQDLIKSIIAARKADIAVTILGWGSNILVSDKGIKGLVIKNSYSEINILEECPYSPDKTNYARLKQVDSSQYYSFKDIDYIEETSVARKVNISSGTPLPLTINTLIRQGITGLQWFSGIPGTIGGAVYNNIHGGSHFIAEFVSRVEVLDENNNLTWIDKEQLDFAYDYSIFQTNTNYIVSVEFCFPIGDKDKALAASTEWARKKSLQPSNSAGCTYQNITETEQEKLGLESNSWGYIIDKILGLKGKQIGQAKISDKHAAFIETYPGATSEDVIKVMELIASTSKEKLGIIPHPEIFFLGFNDDELKHIK